MAIRCGLHGGQDRHKKCLRVVPVHPVDRHLLATAWRGKLFVDGALPFGLRTAPKIFTALADALKYIIKQHGVEHLWHYLDDYITVGKPGCQKCATNLDIMMAVCHTLGVPLASNNEEEGYLLPTIARYS